MNNMKKGLPSGLVEKDTYIDVSSKNLMPESEDC
jgi:hypothetical protein